jgi:hypothetical protein
MQKDVIYKFGSRGKFINIMLIVYGLLLILRLFSLLAPSAFKVVYSDGPSWTYALNALAFLLDLIGLIAIIFWKRWGLFVIIIVTIAFIIFDSIAVNPKPGILTHVITLIPLALLTWAIERKWKYFKWK